MSAITPSQGSNSTPPDQNAGPSSSFPVPPQWAVKGVVHAVAVAAATGPLDTAAVRRVAKLPISLGSVMVNYWGILGAQTIRNVAKKEAFWLTESMTSPWIHRQVDSPVLQETGAFTAATIGETLVATPFTVSQQYRRIRPGVGLFAAGKAVVQAQGVRGLFRGFAATVATGSVTNTAVFAGSEKIKNVVLLAVDENTDIPESMKQGLNFTAGFVAGAAAAPITYIPNRIIMEQRLQWPNTANPLDSFAGTTMKLIKEGAGQSPGKPIRGALRALALGVEINMAGAGVRGGVAFLVIEGVKRLPIYNDDQQAAK